MGIEEVEREEGKMSKENLSNKEKTFLGDLSKLIEEFEKDGSIVGVRVTFTNKDLTIDDNIKYS